MSQKSQTLAANPTPNSQPLNLASSPDSAQQFSYLLNEHQAAAILNVAVKTLRNWRCRGDGPVFVKLGAKSIRYRDDDLTAFIGRDVRTSTSNGGL